MQSNAAVRCRATLMVACAIAIPAVAIFGKFLPDLLWDQCCRRLAAAGSTVLPKPAEPQSTSFATVNPTPELTGLELPKSASWPGLNQVRGDGEGIDTQVSAALPSGGANGGVDALPPEDVASRTTSVGLSGTPASVPAGDQFTAIQQRLRQLGATWYALETWGNEGRFHFACRVAIDGNPGLGRRYSQPQSAFPGLRCRGDPSHGQGAPRSGTLEILAVG